MLKSADDWTLLELPPKTTPKKSGILFLSPEDMEEAKKSMKEKGIKAEDVLNLPPIEEIHGLDTPTQVVKVNSLKRFDEGAIAYNKVLVNARTNLTITLLSKNTLICMLPSN